VICYVNVRHAGTGFVVNHLFAGLKVDDVMCTHDFSRAPDAAWSHVHAHRVAHIRRVLPHAKAIFTTFRAGIDDSCMRRKEDLWTLWREKQQLFDLQCEFDILPLHLEIPGRRDEELAEINRRSGLSMTTNWERVPSMNGPADGLTVPFAHRL
jgi:hypothetical protein